MPFVTVGREKSAAIRIYHEDHGSGRWAVQAFADWAESHNAPGFTRSGYIASICR
jgi:hypothetical protein